MEIEMREVKGLSTVVESTAPLLSPPPSATELAAEGRDGRQWHQELTMGY